MNNILIVLRMIRLFFLSKEETEYSMLAAKDQWTESRDNLHDHPISAVVAQNFTADNDVITKPRYVG